MEMLTDLLQSAKGEIIAGILFALLGWVYSRFPEGNQTLQTAEAGTRAHD